MPPPHIRAIPTRYAGVLFRSRLEARWAVFFDAAGISWTYEPERVALTGRSTYLPDFCTNGSGYVEVKGAEGNLDKPYLLRAVRALGHLTVLGPIPDCRRGVPGRTLLLAQAGKEPLVAVSWADYRPGRSLAHAVRPAGEAQPWLSPPFAPGGCTGTCPYDTARSARFEHGQSGRV